MSYQAISCGLLLLSALPCTAGAANDKAPPGFHDVTFGSGDHKTVVRVKDSMKPEIYGGKSDSDPNSPNKYNPEALNFGKSSSMANKTFDPGFASLSKNSKDIDSRDSQTFITHPFATTGYNQPDSRYQTVAYSESSRRNNDFSKTYALPATNDVGGGQMFATKTSEFQGKTALDTHMPPKSDPFATPYSLSDKTFFDPALKQVRHDPYAAPLDVKRLTDLPNRTLTIDEVRNLINHDQKPDLTSDPEPSKALNDPTWEPPTVIPQARTPDAIRSLLVHPTVPTAPPAEAEKEGDLPAPGEMAQPAPESQEPLPK